MKRYVIIAGVNGAGKSTLYQTIDSFKVMERVNIDEIVREFGSWKCAEDVYKAGKIAIRNINDYFENGISFNQETTLCGYSILKNIDRAIELGYRIELHYVGVDSVEIAKSRIAYRVSKGGHGIPDADVERRYEESFLRLIEIIPKCNLVVLYDNTEKFKRFAIYENNKIVSTESKTPEWYKQILQR